MGGRRRRRRTDKKRGPHPGASLLSFSSDAYLNEMGITNRFNLVENTSLGKFRSTRR